MVSKITFEKRPEHIATQGGIFFFGQLQLSRPRDIRISYFSSRELYESLNEKRCMQKNIEGLIDMLAKCT